MGLGQAEPGLAALPEASPLAASTAGFGIDPVGAGGCTGATQATLQVTGLANCRQAAGISS